MYVCMYVRTYVRTYVCMYVCMYVYVYIIDTLSYIGVLHMYMYMYMNMYMYMYMYMYVYVMYRSTEQHLSYQIVFIQNIDLWCNIIWNNTETWKIVSA